jgi:hypothetical protein
MYRKIATLILIAIAASFLTIGTAYAQVTASLQITEYNPESETWISILSIDNELTQGVVINRADGQSPNEDNLSSDQVMIGDNHTFVQNDLTFVYTTITKTVTVFNGTIDGVAVQFNSTIDNGSAILVRNADAYATHNALGILIQNGNVITFAAFNNETRYNIYMPIINN